jgi:GNAT superfamily N-acetyltransferase
MPEPLAREGQERSVRLVVDPAPAAADLALLEERVAEASLAAAGRDEEEFGVFLRGPQAEPLGGISGLVLGRCCELEALWVHDSLRGHGLARALIEAAEAEAARRGCTLVMLHAYDALVPRLYERLGYRTVGLIEDCLAGRPVRWLTKDLRGGPPLDSGGSGPGSSTTSLVPPVGPPWPPRVTASSPRSSTGA